MSTDAFNCPTEGVILSSVGTMLDVWYDTAYTADTHVTGTTLQIRFREHQVDAGTQSWTAGVTLMYVDASGTVTNFSGTEVTQLVGDNVNQDFTLDLSGQSATIPAGSKIGIRVRAISGTSNAMRAYYGSTAGAASTPEVPVPSGVLTVDEKPTTTLTVSSATGTYGGTVDLSATLTDSTATGIAGQTIAFSLNGSSVGSAVTNASGIASLTDVSLAGINASTYPAGVTASFAGTTGYVASNDSDSLTVNPKSLTITGVTAQNKTYDRTATATLNLGGATLVGVVPPDAVSIDSSGASAVFASANAGTHAVTASGFGLTGAGGNYVLAAQPTVPNATINPKGLTISGVVANGKTYDRTTTATLNLGGASLVGVISPDVVTIDSSGASAVFASANAGTHAVTASGFGLTGAAGNYVLSAQPTVPNAAISPKSLTITGVVANNKTYDRTTAATFNLGGASLVGVIAPDPVSIDSSSASGTFASANAGTWAISVSGFGLSNAAGNYVLAAQPTVPNATILTKAASVTPNAASKTYGDADPALSGTLSGFLPADSVTATYNRTAGETVAGSPYAISATLAPAGVLGNYTITYNTANFTITPKSLTITGVTAQNKTYDRTTAATLNLGGATLVGVIPPDVVTINSSGATGTFASANAGLRAVTASGFGLNGAAGNYILSAQPTVPSATINPKGLTISNVVANNKTYDRTAAATFNLSGASLVGVISPDVVSIDSSGASGTFASANAGTWGVTASGFGVTNPNYMLSAQPTVPNATINPKSLTITGVTAQNKTYDRTTAATLNLGGATLVGVIAPDVVTINSSGASAAFSSASAGTHAVTASGFGLTGAAGNYVLSAQPTVPNATINPVELTVTGITAEDKQYDGTKTATLDVSGATLVGVLSGDDVTLDTSAAVGTFASANVGTWTVTVSGLTLDGTAKNNYSLTQPTTTASILGATASVTGIVANDKTYDGTTAATLDYSGATLVGIVPGDDVTLDTSGAVAEFDDANVGTGKTVTISGLALSGDDAGKYLLTQPPASSADITARDLTVTAVASDKPYDGTTTATVTLSTDALAGDEVTTSFTGANFDTSDVGVGKTVTVEGIAIAGADAGNYNLLNTTATDTADITAADVTVTANNQTKIVGQADPVFTYTATGFVGTDTFVVEPVCSVADPHDAAGTYVITCTGGDAGANYTIASYVDGTLTVRAILKLTLRSVAAHDGWILESTETSGVGGTLNTTATTFYVGDDALDRQYRAILSFNTGGLPDNAIITRVILRVRMQGPVGTNPFTTHGRLLAEIRKPYFGTNAALVATDFQAAANKTGGLFGITPVNGWYSVTIGAASFPFVNLTGFTQFRLRFQKDDNDDRGADYMKFFSSNYATANARPTLIIEYTVP
ncbi:MAG: YDG domain-containing protein [Chloroflexota bacterium]